MFEMNQDWLEYESLAASKKVKDRLQMTDALWLYEGDPRDNAPHAELTSGKHSNGYVNVGKVLKEYPAIRKEFAKKILILSMMRGILRESFNWVVGSESSATALAKDIANIAHVGHIQMIKTGCGNGKGKGQLWHPDNRPLKDGDKILQVEDLITTGLSSMLVRRGIREAHPKLEIEFVSDLPVVVDRSDPDNRIVNVENSRIMPLLQLSIKSYDPEHCPYCLAGSKAIPPKGENWEKHFKVK